MKCPILTQSGSEPGRATTGTSHLRQTQQKRHNGVIVRANAGICELADVLLAFYSGINAATCVCTSRLVAAKMALLLPVSRVLHHIMSMLHWNVLNEVYSLEHILTPNSKKPLSFSSGETNKRGADVPSMTHLTIWKCFVLIAVRYFNTMSTE